MKMKNKIITVFIILFSCSIAYSMPSATRYRINLGIGGGYQFTNDSFLGEENNSYGIDNENPSFDGGAVTSLRLEYNNDNYYSWGIESGYMFIKYNNERIDMVPAILNIWTDADFTQGAFVVRFGLCFGYIHVMNNDQFIEKAYIGGLNLSFLFEIYTNVYVDATVKYQMIGIIPENDDDSSRVTLIPIMAGVLFRL